MARRGHKKSRGGCVECKRRHIKCDEVRPLCAHCTRTGSNCIFLDRPKAQLPSVNETRVYTPAGPSPSTPGSMLDSHATGNHSPASYDANNSGDSNYSLIHLKLLHHFSTVTYATFSPDVAQQKVWQSAMIKLSLSFPWLLKEILAIAALHLGHSIPEKRKYWSNKATELQNDALQEFSESQKTINDANCGGVMMFACLLSLHMLADSARIQGLDHYQYLAHVLEWFNLSRGAQIVVVRDWDKKVAQSDLGPLFRQHHPRPPYDIPAECQHLSSLTKNSDLGASSVEAYDEAIDRLFWGFALSNVVSTRHNTIRYILAWPMQLKENFLTLLNERRPEALIILAYYGVLLHFYRENWAIGDAGVAIVKAVRAHTGPYWTEWLAWPERMVELDT